MKFSLAYERLKLEFIAESIDEVRLACNVKYGWKMLSSIFPSSRGGGGCANNKMSRSHRSGAVGEVVHRTACVSDLPVRSVKGGFAIFLLVSRPPLLTRR